MAIELFWGSGSPYAWRVLLALEIKAMQYTSQLIEFSRKDQKSPAFLRMNPRGKVPVLKHDEFIVYESLAIMRYLEDISPQRPIFGSSPRHAARIMMSICETSSYIEQPTVSVVQPIFSGEVGNKKDAATAAADVLREEYTLLNARLTGHQWLVDDAVSAADLVLYPHTAILLRALGKPAAHGLDLRIVPFEEHFPSIVAWMRNVQSLPGYDRTYPPHWRQA
jgi:glutathione S-transferase